MTEAPLSFDDVAGRARPVRRNRRIVAAASASRRPRSRSSSRPRCSPVAAAAAHRVRRHRLRQRRSRRRRPRRASRRRPPTRSTGPFDVSDLPTGDAPGIAWAEGTTIHRADGGTVDRHRGRPRSRSSRRWATAGSSPTNDGAGQPRGGAGRRRRQRRRALPARRRARRPRPRARSWPGRRRTATVTVVQSDGSRDVHDARDRGARALRRGRRHQRGLQGGADARTPAARCWSTPRASRPRRTRHHLARDRRRGAVAGSATLTAYRGFLARGSPRSHEDARHLLRRPGRARRHALDDLRLPAARVRPRRRAPGRGRVHRRRLRRRGAGDPATPTAPSLVHLVSAQDETIGHAAGPGVGGRRATC